MCACTMQKHNMVWLERLEVCRSVSECPHQGHGRGGDLAHSNGPDSNPYVDAGGRYDCSVTLRLALAVNIMSISGEHTLEIRLS